MPISAEALKLRRRELALSALEEWRARCGLNVREFAKHMGKHYQQVAPSNLRNASLEYLLALLDRTDYRVRFEVTRKR